jgi:hypothetical protein
MTQPATIDSANAIVNERVLIHHARPECLRAHQRDELLDHHARRHDQAGAAPSASGTRAQRRDNRDDREKPDRRLRASFRRCLVGAHRLIDSLRSSSQMRVVTRPNSGRRGEAAVPVGRPFGLDDSMNLPGRADMTPTLSASMTASSIECVISTTVAPGSSPEVEELVTHQKPRLLDPGRRTARPAG